MDRKISPAFQPHDLTGSGEISIPCMPAIQELAFDLFNNLFYKIKNKIYKIFFFCLLTKSVLWDILKRKKNNMEYENGEKRSEEYG